VVVKLELTYETNAGSRELVVIMQLTSLAASDSVFIFLSSIQHLTNDGYPKDKWEDYQNLFPTLCTTVVRAQ